MTDEDGLRTALESPELASVDFCQLAQQWASHSLERYKDGLLTKALQIAKALAEFDCELKNPGQWD